MGTTPRAPATRIVALTLMLALGVLATLFTAGEAFEDPGGAEAFGLVASWLVPLVIVSAAAWRWPDHLGPLLFAATVVLLALAVWNLADPDAWRRVEDGTGPVRAIAAFALAIPVAVHAFHRPRLGGALLLVIALGPLVLGAFAQGRNAGAAATRLLAVPMVIAGVLDLASARSDASVDRSARLAK